MHYLAAPGSEVSLSSTRSGFKTTGQRSTAYHGAMGSAFPDLSIVIHDLVQVPGRIAVPAEIAGTHRGTLFGIAATGKRVSFRLQ
jgi:predicted ester cyclase